MAIFRGAGGPGDATTDAANEASVASTKAAEAAASATAAASSATSAATSATSADADATSASTSETNAAASALAAATSETNASTSETNAGTSAANAAISATAAATSATNAATSETNSATSEANAATSAATAAAEAAAALAAFDNFDDKYLGAKASDPTLDNDGDALVAGALYFNTTSGVMNVYTGSAWVAAYVSATGVLLQANNLSDVASAATSRTNLGLGTTDSPTFSNLTLDNPAGTNDTTSFTQSISGLNILARNGNNPGIINFKRYVSGTEETSATIDQFGSFNAVSLTAESLSLKDSAGTTQYALIQEVGGDLNFYSRNNTADGNITFSGLANGFPTEHVRIDSSGNVGINTNIPTEKLDVSGNIAVSGTVDGRDIAVDGTTLDTIEPLATSATQPGDNVSTLTNDAGYLTSFTETNDLTAAVTWANVPDANITQSSVTQHQAALSVTESQISDLGTYVTKTSATGSAEIPSGTTAQRDVSPSAGYLRFNSTDTSFEGYDGSAWGAIGGGGGASGGGSDAIFYENGQTITTSYSITASTNAMSTGPLTVNSGVSVTVPSGSRWVVL
jgi:hypothetical protein